MKVERLAAQRRCNERAGTQQLEYGTPHDRRVTDRQIALDTRQWLGLLNGVEDALDQNPGKQGLR